MKLRLLGYVLPGNIEKQLWEIKQQGFRRFKDPMWLFFPPVLPLECGSGDVPGDSGYLRLSSPLEAVDIEASGGFQSLRMHPHPAGPPQPPEALGEAFGGVLRGIPLGPKPAFPNGEFSGLLQSLKGLSFFPVQLASWSWELPDLPWGEWSSPGGSGKRAVGMRRITLETKPVRKLRV